MLRECCHLSFRDNWLYKDDLKSTISPPQRSSVGRAGTVTVEQWLSLGRWFKSVRWDFLKMLNQPTNCQTSFVDNINKHKFRLVQYKNLCHFVKHVVSKWRDLSVNIVSHFDKMRRPGIEPGPPAWKADILPLNYRRLYINTLLNF